MHNFIARKISSAIENAAKTYSVITITGPRQSGKTTLMRHLFPELPYYSLENYDMRELAVSDPVGFLKGAEKGMILDEVQNAPLLMSYIQGLVDDNPELRFILSGSSNFSMLKTVTQTLAGRTAIFELLPLSVEEIRNQVEIVDLDTLLYKGFYPTLWSTEREPLIMYPNYIKTYLERDVRDLLAVKDLATFQKFLKLCAARIGSVFNASEISNELGIAVNTVKSWLSVLEASYIVVLLQPYYTNTRKRLTKSPKLYFMDTGLVCSLLEIESPKQLQRDKMRGHVFENFIIAEAIKQRFNQGRSNNLNFYRDSNGNEVDLITKTEGMLNLYEIKSSETFHSDYEKGIKKFCAQYPDMVNDKYIVYSGDVESVNREIKLIKYINFRI